MITFSVKSIKIPISNPISDRREIAARCRLGSGLRRFSVASFVLDLSPVPLRLERKSRAGSEGFLMYFHLVCSPEIFAVASGRKSTRKVFRPAPKLMDLKDHEFRQNPTSPPYAFLSWLFHVGISLCLGKRVMRVSWATYGCGKPKSISHANADSVSL